jgi:hypothetical protein
MLMMLVIAMAVVVRPSTIVIRAIWITAVVAVAAGIIPISRVPVVAIAGVTEPDAYSSDPD